MKWLPCWRAMRRARSILYPLGSGEPTLNRELGWSIRQVKALTDIPVAVITNGVLLHLPEVRQELRAADVVMPTLSAGSADVYKRIHRPHPEATYACLVEGLLAFVLPSTAVACGWRSCCWPG